MNADWRQIRCVAVDQQVLVSGTTNWTRLELVVPSGYEGVLALNLGVAARLVDTALVTDPAVAVPVLAELREAGLEVLVVPAGDSAEPARAVPVQAITAAAGRPAVQVCYVGPGWTVEVGPAVAAGMPTVLVAPQTTRDIPEAAVVIADLRDLPELLIGAVGRRR